MNKFIQSIQVAESPADFEHLRFSGRALKRLTAELKAKGDVQRPHSRMEKAKVLWARIKSGKISGDVERAVRRDWKTEFKALEAGA